MARDKDLTRHDERGLSRLEPYGGPFRMLERFADEMDRVFDDFGFGRASMTPRLGREWPATRGSLAWTPEVEMFHRDSELVVRMDLPGLTKDDVKVEVQENRLTIQGERKREHEEEREGVYRSERMYGTFCREIPLPPGCISDQASPHGGDHCPHLARTGGERFGDARVVGGGARVRVGDRPPRARRRTQSPQPTSRPSAACGGWQTAGTQSISAVRRSGERRLVRLLNSSTVFRS